MRKRLEQQRRLGSTSIAKVEIPTESRDELAPILRALQHIFVTTELNEESERTFKKLRHKHSAVESDINRLEHHGLDRCLDKGIVGFKRYCALGILAANLHTMGNILQRKAQKKETVRKAA